MNRMLINYCYLKLWLFCVIIVESTDNYSNFATYDEPIPRTHSLDRFVHKYSKSGTNFMHRPYKFNIHAYLLL